MTRKGELITGLDIGTTKICVIVAELTENGIEIIGCGVSPSQGLKKGVVVNIDATVQSIQAALKEAEESLKSDDKATIEAATEKLMTASQKLAGLVDDRGLFIARELDHQQRLRVAGRSAPCGGWRARP